MHKQKYTYRERLIVITEIWRDVPGYIGRYQVSNFGDIKSVDRFCRSRYSMRICKGVPLKKFNDGSGYWYVNLSNGKSAKKIAVHRIVLMAFIGPPMANQQACHNDGVRSNSRLSNLRWDTAKGNMADKTAHGTSAIGEKNPQSVLTEKQVLEILKSKQSSLKLAPTYGVASSMIRAVRLKQNWAHISQ